MPTLGEELRSLRERSGWSAKHVAQLASLSAQTVYAVERMDANWSSATAYARALGRRMLIDTGGRNRKLRMTDIARQADLSINTAQKCALIVARPDALDVDVHLASLAAYLETIGGDVVVRR